jgi:hypothetical protein
MLAVSILSWVLAAAIVLAPLLSVVGVWAWARKVGERQNIPRFASRVAYALAILGAASIAFGVVSGSVSGLSVVSGERIDPSQKARVLAEGISEAMNCGALGFLLTVIAALWLSFFTWRWRHA